MEIAPDALRLGVELGEPRHDDDQWESKLELVRSRRVPVVSFTFGCPGADTIEQLQPQRRGVGTVTSPLRTRRRAIPGADALVVQGTEAGGHRGGFLDDGSGLGLLVLLRLVVNTSRLPMIASGGIGDGSVAAAALCAELVPCRSAAP